MPQLVPFYLLNQINIHRTKLNTSIMLVQNKVIALFLQFWIINVFITVMKKFSLLYIYRLIKNNLIFKFVLLIILLVLIMIVNVEPKTFSYFILGLILLSIVYSSIKAKNKVEHIITLLFNFLFIILFWYIIGECFNIEIMYSLLGSYILLGFDDFDLSADVESILGLHLHKWCIGDPGGPGGPGGGPNFSPLFCMNISDRDWEIRNDFDDRLNESQNHPALRNYKEYIEYKDFKYKRSSIEMDIKQYNDNLLYTKTNEFVFEKQEITKYLEDERKLNNIYSCSRSESVTPLDYINQTQKTLYEYTLEYNTLKKAKLYYENKNLNLSKDYEDAFEIWQKRQIALSLGLYYNLKTESLGYDGYIDNWYQSSIVYNEIRDNLLHVELSLIKIKSIYDALNAEKFNYFKLEISEFDKFVLPIMESHYEKYSECRNFLNQKCIERFDVDHMPKSAVDFWWKKVVIPYKEHFKQYHINHNKYHDAKVGLGLAEKFSKKNFNLTNYMSSLYKN